MKLILKYNLCKSLKYIPIKFEIVIKTLKGDVEEDTGVDHHSRNLHNNKQSLIGDISNLPSF